MRPLEAIALLAASVAGPAAEAARHLAALALWAAARGAGAACAWLDGAAERVDRRARCAAGPHWVAAIDLDPEDGLCPSCGAARDAEERGEWERRAAWDRRINVGPAGQRGGA